MSNYWVEFDARAGLRLRRSGMEIRDCLLVIGPTGVRVGWLVREPLEGTVVESVVSARGGALCIDACRIEGGVKQASAGSLNGYGGSSTGHYEKGTGARFTSEGRFPPNTVLVHGPGCRREGVRAVRGSNPAGQGIGSAGARTRGVYGEGDPGSFKGNGTRVHYGEGGVEAVPAWECRCIVGRLDEQSGDRRSAGMYPTTYSNGHGYHFKQNVQGPLYDDAGGASRFYAQCANEREFETWLSTLLCGPLPPAPQYEDD